MIWRFLRYSHRSQQCSSEPVTLLLRLMPGDHTVHQSENSTKSHLIWFNIILISKGVCRNVMQVILNDTSILNLHLVGVECNTCQFHIDLRLEERFNAPIMLCTWCYAYCAEMSCTSFSCSHSVWVISSVYVGAVEPSSISSRKETFTG